VAKLCINPCNYSRSIDLLSSIQKEAFVNRPFHPSRQSAAVANFSG